MKSLIILFWACWIASPVAAQRQDNKQTPKTKPVKKLTADEQLKIMVQQICPVSGQKLGTKGTPIKIKAGEQTTYLCCKSCLKKKINSKHWNAIQDRLAKAQGTCPIMDKPVDSKMKSTIVKGQKIFVCCPPCIPKIEKQPDEAIKKVNSQFTKFIAAEKQTVSDNLQIKAQGICPVTGEKLGSRGKPVKVKVGTEIHAFLCCKGCVGKKISAEHWKTIQSNLAKAQKVCPVMKKPVDSSMSSVVVKGRKFFVCCPPCIQKIKDEPQKHIDWLNAQIADAKQTIPLSDESRKK